MKRAGLAFALLAAACPQPVTNTTRLDAMPPPLVQDLAGVDLAGADLVAPPIVPGTELVVSGYRLTTRAPSGPGDTLSICVNEAPPGTPRIFKPGDEGPGTAVGPDFLEATNQTTRILGSFRYGLGVHHVATGQEFACGWGPRQGGPGAGGTARYVGPYCCTFSATILPRGSFRWLVIADADHETTTASGRETFEGFELK